MLILIYNLYIPATSYSKQKIKTFLKPNSRDDIMSTS